MSITIHVKRTIAVAGAALWLAACGGQPTPDVDSAVQTALAQTRAAEASISQAVAATLTASAPTLAPQQPQPSDTPAPAATDTPDAGAPPTSTPVATNTPAPTSTPTPVQIVISPALTPTPVRIALSPVDGDDGNDFLRGSAAGNNGRNILLPGFDQANVEGEPTFRDFINFRVEVFDTRAGLYDGAGIQDVTFRIVADDGAGDIVWEKREVNPAFCVFGGDLPDCAPGIRFGADARWPAPFAGRITNNVYLAEIDITPVDGDATQWRWRFFIDSPTLEQTGQANTARINRIWEDGGRYFVDFDTYGFTPQLPGQHVHFFWNTVPQQQAGMPGAGPWQLYPAQPGGENSSPFTLFTVADRPSGATQICILVANNDHSVNQGTGNCVDAP